MADGGHGSKALAVAESKLERLKGRLSRVGEIAEEQSRKFQRGLTASAAAYAMGAIEKDATAHSRTLPTIAGMDPKLTYATAAYFAAPLVGGRPAEIIEDIALGLMVSYAHQLGSR